jgi:hypothetical protein
MGRGSVPRSAGLCLFSPKMGRGSVPRSKCVCVCFRPKWAAVWFPGRRVFVCLRSKWAAVRFQDRSAFGVYLARNRPRFGSQLGVCFWIYLELRFLHLVTADYLETEPHCVAYSTNGHYSIAALLATTSSTGGHHCRFDWPLLAVLLVATSRGQVEIQGPTASGAGC